MSEVIQNLKKSPIYNLSLSSLENFHTEFLKWIGENYPKQFLKVFTDKNILDDFLIEFETQTNYGKSIKLDLQIKITHENRAEEYIFVENKLKSFPTEEQLNKYSEHLKDKSATFILLSLAPNLIDLPDKWQYQSYDDFAIKLKTVFNSNFSYKDSYHKFLIEDYIQTIENISNLFPKNNSEKYDFYLHNQLDEIGLKDIYVKYKTSELESFIKQNFSNNNMVYTYSGFSNKKGFIGIECELENVKFGIQIEGMQYRYLVCAESHNVSADTVKQVAEILFADNLWFNNTNPPKGKAKSNVFCQYKTDKYLMLYRYKELNETFTYQEIAEKVKNDIEILHKNEAKIREIIKEVTP